MKTKTKVGDRVRICWNSAVGGIRPRVSPHAYRVARVSGRTLHVEAYGARLLVRSWIRIP